MKSIVIFYSFGGNTRRIAEKIQNVIGADLDEVVHEKGQELEEKTRYLAILATLIGCQGKGAYQ